MRLLKVVSAGPSVTVQDAGRPGWSRYGVTEGGALDPYALAEARALTGADAALEMAGFGGVFEASAPLDLALTGARMRATLDGAPIAPRTVFGLKPGARLSIGPAEEGFYGYLAAAGGFDCPVIMGARATHPRAGFGGWKGRALQAGDALPIGPGEAPPRTLPAADYLRRRVFRVLWGAQAHMFSEAERRRFLDTPFRVGAARDRMGALLETEAAPIACEGGLSGVSDSIVAGDLQIPGDGRPRALLADRQPTGGYPRLATIIGADLAALAQLPTGADLRFELTDEATALKALAGWRTAIAALPKRLRPATREPDAADLARLNLISGVTAGEDV